VVQQVDHDAERANASQCGIGGRNGAQDTYHEEANSERNKAKEDERSTTKE
jgi:hypothetical protein